MKVKELSRFLENRPTITDLFLRGLGRDRRHIGLDRYRIIRKLGQGASGVVYLVWDEHIQRHVAIKVSHAKSEDRIMVEAQSAGRLRNPNIVDIHDANVEGEWCYITMEYVEGPSLSEFCRKENRLPLQRVVEITMGVCSGLEYAHRGGIVHRDIKPSNIILDAEGIPKITDFGIAQTTGRTMRFGVFGTPGYMSPEQLKDEPVTVRSDIFSLGCVLYELITGEKAFSGENCYTTIYKVINQKPPSISTLSPSIPEVLERITERTLSKDPADRYETCSEMAGELKVALRGLGGTAKEGKIYDVLDYVNHLPFFRGFQKEQIQELIGASTIIRVRAGVVIVAEGEISDTFCVLLKGRVKVSKDSRDIAYIEAGQCFGEMASIGGQARVADVIAVEECILMKISAQVLDAASESIQMRFYKIFATTLIHRLSKTSGESHSRNPVEQVSG